MSCFDIKFQISGIETGYTAKADDITVYFDKFHKAARFLLTTLRII